jgi:flagellar hook-associated protein 2
MATTGIDSSSLAISGLASGFDWQSFITSMVQAERAPESTMRSRQGTLQQRNSAYANIKTQLTTLQSDIDAFKDASLYTSRTAQSANTAAATVSADNGAAQGTYTFNFTQLATASTITGTSNVASPLSDTSDVSQLTLGLAGFSPPVTAGSFTVNGQQLQVTTANSLQDVLSAIESATATLPPDQQVTAAYDPKLDAITLSSAGTIILGSATDTSNFLQSARLSNNDSGFIQSSQPLGSITTGIPLASLRLQTPLTYDQDSGAGQFTINGVNIDFNANTDTVASVMSRINNSAAGVSLTYDASHDRFLLTSTATGNLGIALQDQPGSNLLDALGLSTTGLSRGKDLNYTINNGSPLTSHSNTITSDSSGLSGLTVTALQDNTPVTVTVASDTSQLQSALQTFLKDYNAVQSYISTQTASSTDATGKVSAGLLADDGLADDITASIRTAVFTPLNGLSGTFRHLADLGYQTNGYNNQLALPNSDQLTQALANHLSDVQQFFTDSDHGFVAKLDSALKSIIGDDGSLATHQTNLNKQSSGLDDQIARLEKTITADQARMTKEFQAMETAEAQINQQLSYLTKSFA